MYIFLGIDVDEQLFEVKNKAMLIDNNIGFKNSCFTLPLHISLKTSFYVDKSLFDDVIQDVVNYYSTIQAFKIQIQKLEICNNIIWIRMVRNEGLDSVHDYLNEMLLDKYNIKLHEYDLNYKYHTTLFMDDNVIGIKEAAKMIDKVELPESIIAEQFIIGISETGELGSYEVYKKIKRNNVP